MIRPLHDNVVLKIVCAPREKMGSIFIPDASQEKPQEAEVVAVGPGRRDHKGRLWPCNVLVGETVTFSKYSGHEVTIDGEDLIIMRDADLLAVLPPL